MRIPFSLAAAPLAAAVAVAVATPAWALPDGLPQPAQRPVPGAVGRAFRAAEPDWTAGHRGVDLMAPPGTPVVAAADGVVSFAGTLAGRGVVVVDHGEVRTTYEPVTAGVAPGARIKLGEPLGTLQAGHPGCPAGCLHWGLRRGERYLDPMLLLTHQPVRLVGHAYQPAPPPPSAGPPGAAPGPRGGGALIRPDGPVTSEFGMRVHPVLGTRSLHDGTDFGLPCGAPIRPVAPGVVTRAGWGGGLGQMVEIDHGWIGGSHIVSRYGHASSLLTAPGNRVEPSAVVARVGTTGWSTGCHLHLTILVDGTPRDPLTLLR